MSNIELRMPDSMVIKLDIIGAVDELTRGEVIRMAVREWLEELDWKWYRKEYGKLGENESESEEDSSNDDFEEDNLDEDIELSEEAEE